MKILTPKDLRFLIEVTAFQNYGRYLLFAVQLESLLKIVLVAKIENPFDDEPAVLLVVNFGNVPKE
jgi:hypothetical protein